MYILNRSTCTLQYGGVLYHHIYTCIFKNNCRPFFLNELQFIDDLLLVCPWLNGQFMPDFILFFSIESTIQFGGILHVYLKIFVAICFKINIDDLSRYLCDLWSIKIILENKILQVLTPVNLYYTLEKKRTSQWRCEILYLQKT